MGAVSMTFGFDLIHGFLNQIILSGTQHKSGAPLPESPSHWARAVCLTAGMIGQGQFHHHNDSNENGQYPDSLGYGQKVKEKIPPEISPEKFNDEPEKLSIK